MTASVDPSWPKDRLYSCSRISGLTLLFALALFVLLSTLGFLFVYVARTQTRITATEKDDLEAHLLADSGYQKALAFLQKQLQENLFLTKPTVTFSEVLQRDQGKTYLYVARVSDLSSCINVNASNAGTVHLLNNLSQLLYLSLPAGEKLSVVPGREGEKSAFESFRSIEDAWGKEAFSHLAPFLTLANWADSKVIRPVPLSERVGASPRWRSLGFPPVGVAQPIFSRVLLAPTQIALEPRSPVNVNDASLEVITATLMNLSGYHVEPSPAQGGWPDDPEKLKDFHYPPELLSLGTLRKATLSVEKAQHLAQAIYGRVHQKSESSDVTDSSTSGLSDSSTAGFPFTGWQEFTTFIRGQTYLTSVEQDLVLANADPNTHLNKFDIPKILDKTLDKTDLDFYTTEFTFYPTGYFLIESEGIVTSQKGIGNQGLGNRETDLNESKILARYPISVTVKLFDLYRDTTQKDFLQGTLSNGLETYPEPTYPAYQPNQYSYLSDGYVKLKSRGVQKSESPDVTNSPTFPSFRGVSAAGGQGVPSPNSQTPGLTFYASFDKSYDADFALGDKTHQKNAFGRPTNQALISDNPTSLSADGLYLDPLTSVGYSANKNFPESTLDLFDALKKALSTQKVLKPYLETLKKENPKPLRLLKGAMSFWFKSRFDLLRNNQRARLIFRAENPECHPKLLCSFYLFTYSLPRSFVMYGKRRNQVVSPFFVGWGDGGSVYEAHAPDREDMGKAGIFQKEWNFVQIEWDSTGFADFAKRLEKLEVDEKSPVPIFNQLLGQMLHLFKIYSPLIKITVNGQESSWDLAPTMYRWNRRLQNLFSLNTPPSTFQLGATPNQHRWNQSTDILINNFILSQHPVVKDQEKPSREDNAEVSYSSPFFDPQKMTNKKYLWQRLGHVFFTLYTPPHARGTPAQLFFIIKGKTNIPLLFVEGGFKKDLSEKGEVTLTPFEVERWKDKPFRYGFSWRPQNPQDVNPSLQSTFLLDDVTQVFFHTPEILSRVDNP